MIRNISEKLFSFVAPQDFEGEVPEEVEIFTEKVALVGIALAGTVFAGSWLAKKVYGYAHTSETLKEINKAVNQKWQEFLWGSDPSLEKEERDDATIEDRGDTSIVVREVPPLRVPRPKSLEMGTLPKSCLKSLQAKQGSVKKSVTWSEETFKQTSECNSGDDRRSSV